jgi:N-carbamoylputrescine amidase
MKQLKVALIQQSCSDNREETFTKTCDMVRQAAAEGARLVVLQELHSGLYFCQTEETGNFNRAEAIPGPATDRLGKLASALNIVLVTSLFERRAPGLYHNTAVVFEQDGTIAGTYRKMHIPDDPGFYEKFYFTPGDLGFNPIRTSVGTLGVLVCWDQWYPEAARLMALAGADLLIYPTAIGWDPHDDAPEQDQQLDAWKTIQRSHAVANGLPVLTVNRIGFEASPDPNAGGIRFWGTSFIAGPQGELLAQGSADKEEIIAIELNMERSETVRRIWPFLRDRRIDAYGDLTRRFRD